MKPKIRFDEFNNDWNYIYLKEFLQFKNGINADSDKFGHGIKCISVSDILKNNYITYDNIRGMVDIDENVLSEYSVEYGDILFQRSSENVEDAGKSNVYLDKQLATFNGFVIRGKKIKDYNPIFMQNALKTFMVRKEIMKKAQGAQHINVGQDILANIKLYIPILDEQNKISNLFKLIDKKIELQKQRINALKLYKKGLTQKLFKIFPTHSIKVKNLGKIITGTTPSKDNNLYWYNGNIPWITPTDITESKNICNSIAKLTQEGLKKGRYIPKNSILITCIASIGKNAVLKVDGSCNQQINAIIPNENYNCDYIYYLINNMSKYMMSIAGTSATSIINKEQFSNMEINVHNNKTQFEISNILNKLELKLELNKEKLENLIDIKKSLLQQMFI